MTAYIGGAETEGQKLKATSGWINGGNGTDEFGFSALPGGYSDSSGYFNSVGNYSLWWGASDISAASAYSRNMDYTNEGASWNNDDKSNLFSVRCVKD